MIPHPRVIARYPAERRPIRPALSLGNAGGGSGALLWRFESMSGELVLRAWPPEGPSRNDIVRIHGWLGRLADLSFVPVPLRTTSGETLIESGGLLWELAPWIDGEPVVEHSLDAALLRPALSALAAVHDRLAPLGAPGPSPGLSERALEVDAWLDAGLAKLRDRVAGRLEDPYHQAAVRWMTLAGVGLVRLRPRLGTHATTMGFVQPVLRDARAEHFLFERRTRRVVGLVDYGAMGWDDPATDLARLLIDWAGPDSASWSAASEAYREARSPGGSPTRLDRVEAFAESAAWLGPGRWLRWHYLQNRVFTDPSAVRNGLSRTLTRLEERLGLSPTFKP